MRLRSLAPALLSAALLALPSSARASVIAPTDSTEPTASVALAASRAGLYRLTLTTGSNGAQQIDLAIEQVNDGFTALVITPAHESWIENVKFDGKRLTGTTLTSAGRGHVLLEMSETGVHGTLVVGGRAIAISGERER